MSSTSKSKSQRNAIASWAGYIYQGNVGIYIALKHIKELEINYPKEEDFSEELKKWSLVNEGPLAEDFDIRRNGEVISRHQVKRVHCQKVSTYSNYRTPRSSDHNTGFECKGAEYAKKYLHTIVDISDWWEANTINDWKKCGKKDHTFIENTSGVELYKYKELGENSDEAEQSFCAVKELEGELKKQIEKFSGQDLSYDCLVSKICAEVLSTKDEAVLQFDEIYSYITGTSDRFDQYNQYQAEFRMVNTIHSIIDEMCEDNPAIDLTGLNDFIDKLLQSKDWRSILQKVIINHNLGGNLKDPVYQKGLKQVYFKFIEQLGLEYPNFLNSYQTHIITSIIDDADEINSLRSRIEKTSKEVQDVAEILFEYSYLVNKNIEGEYLIQDEQNIPEEFQKIMSKKMTSSDSILKPQNMKFKKVSTLINEVKKQSS